MRWSGRTLALVLTLMSATIGAVAPAGDAYRWTLPERFPEPRVPADNPMSDAKVELGRHLFYDTRLSQNGTQSCGSCHQQALAFTDGNGRSVGSTGEVHPRGSMSLVNVAYQAPLTWANPTITRLEDQALVPMYGEHPVELGLVDADTWIEQVRRDPVYRRLFPEAFGPLPASVTRSNVAKSIASFERAIMSARSPYDRYHNDRDDTALSAAARRGERLFFSQPLSCFRATAASRFPSPDFVGRRDGEVEFHNTGLYNLNGVLSYPELQHRPLRGFAPAAGCGEVQGADAAQHRRHRSVHARRQHGDADGRARALRGGRTDDCRWPPQGDRQRESQQECHRPRLRPHHRSARRPARIPRRADRSRDADRTPLR